MNKTTAIAILSLVLSLFSSPPSIYSAGSGGGGGNGGGSIKPTTVRYVGIITKLEPTAGGVLLTVGTSYYAVGTSLVTSDTKIKLNGTSSVLVNDLQLGDTASINLLWPSRVAVKIEATGPR